MLLRALALLIVAASFRLYGQAALPVGLVVEGAGLLVRSGTESALAVRPGDLLYIGDTVDAGAAEVAIWFCPALQHVAIEPGARAAIERQSIAARTGRVRIGTALSACQLPPVPKSEPGGPAFTGSRLRRDEEPFAPESLEQRLASLPEDRRNRARQELAAIDRLLAAQPNRPELHSVKGALLVAYGLHAEAAAEYRRVAGVWTGVDWPRLLVHEEEDLDRRARPKTAPDLSRQGKVFALVVGINSYPHLSAQQQLHFADRDAEDFMQFLQSARGGSVPASNIKLLTNESATVDAIRTGVQDFLKVRAGKQDTVVVFIAAHGVADERGAYILAHNSNPQDLATTALRMQEVQDLLDGELNNINRTLLYVDVCRAGHIGTIQENKLGRIVQALTRLRGAETFGLLATSPGESSKEGERFGGGHGAFSYFVLDGLNGAADQNKNGFVDVGELSIYVQVKVREATRGEQNPRPAGDMASTAVLVESRATPGIALSGWTMLEDKLAMPRQAAPAPTRPPAPSSTVAELAAFDTAIREGKLLPGEPGNAFDALELVSRRFGSRRLETLDYENRLWVSLLDSGQSVLLRYLEGDRIPQRAADFERGERWFRAALQLDPQAAAVESRALFCQARAWIFERRYPEAIASLERALRIDPEGAYLYNALGIAYLELGQIPRAASGFRDAIRFAPAWIYPRHNLAVTLGESGDVNASVAAYQAAKRIAPNYWYLPYNLGLVYQRRNQRRDAERELRKAIAIAPDRPEPYNALGLIKAAQRKTKEAQRLYTEALAKDSTYLPAQHNMALLAFQRRDYNEATRIWRKVLAKDPDFLPSRFGLAEVLESSGSAAEATAQYREILRRQPDSESAKQALSRMETAAGRR